MNSSKKPIRAAIVGTGFIAHEHIQAILKANDRIELIAAMEINETALHAFCETYGISNRYTDLETMLEETRPQLVHICTPPAIHYEIGVKCMRAGAWVWGEKPALGSLKEVDQIRKVEEETGTYFSSVYQWRFGSAGGHIKRLIQEEAMGKPLTGVSQTFWYRDADYYAVPWRGKWKTELGGASVSQGIHANDFFFWLMGDWNEVSAAVETLDRKIEVEDVLMAMVKFENGALGQILNSVLAPNRNESYLRLDLQKCTVECKHMYQYKNEDWIFSPKNDVSEEEVSRWRAIDGDQVGDHYAQLSYLLDCMEQGTRPSSSGDGLRSSIEFVTSLYKSAVTKSWVKRGSVVEGDPFYESFSGAH
ncbi:Gfo/Idh/MocA family protein [Paenibacillus agricola]|uniref:Gfo/Idh/MocA family oxidoreductase n=1 Tax=Paenibacillus agricola TaxID=2716264 RepID=A0ABX0JH75_9BACL|nr:Gfo/Idh/MocA family oxidoreductase [Paenibacillus agricola]NHN34908.1 Gfo/Idh/MocA family oxidoreductase [Paenibacillus agricola]